MTKLWYSKICQCITAHLSRSRHRLGGQLHVFLEPAVPSIADGHQGSSSAPLRAASVVSHASSPTLSMISAWRFVQTQLPPECVKSCHDRPRFAARARFSALAARIHNRCTSLIFDFIRIEDTHIVGGGGSQFS